MRLALKTISATSRTHNALCIFFHGSGDTGENLIEWVRSLLGRDMEFPHIKIIYPTAPEQSYTPFGGEVTNVWFDRRSVSMDAPENPRSMAQVYDNVRNLISSEMAEGIPANRIIVGGFSMGGALAMHTGFHLNTELGGVFACSAFLNRDSVVYESLQKQNTHPELRMYHGDNDDVVPFEWGKETFDQLTQLGVAGEFTRLNNVEHELTEQALLDIQDWILRKLP